jgi:hydrogenase maturation protease
MLHTLLIGFGSLLRGDDGVGVRVAERLEGECLGEGVRVVAVHQLLPEHVELLRTARRAVFVDAAEDVPPGELVAGALAPADAAAVTFHHLTPAVLLAACASLNGVAPDAILVRIGVASTETSTELSPLLASRFDGYCERVRGLLSL